MSTKPQRIRVSLRDRWTYDALYCYTTGQNCAQCPAARVIDFDDYGGCKMPLALPKVLAQQGRPSYAQMLGAEVTIEPTV